MGNDVIIREDISVSINKLQEINSDIPESASFDAVKEKSGPFKHKVTGEELNKLIRSLQVEFREQNRRDSLTFEELKKIYDALSILDSEYIQKLVNSAEQMKVLKSKVDDVEITNVQLSEKINKVIETQNVILDKFSSFDNVLLLEEECRNQKKQIELLNEEKQSLNKANIEYGGIIKSLKQKMIYLYISIGIIGVISIVGIVLNIMGVF